MKKKLSEGKFRWINEQLYTTTGSKALEMFQKNPQLFDEYHDGFRSAVESWPINPVDIILLYLKQKSKEIIVADLGCGEGKIGLEAPNKVLSFDLVAKHDKVIVCDIAKLPIPDSFFDIVIFCLSLMGTNYIEYLKEAHRVLKTNGELKVTEVVSRFSDINAFIEVLAEIGFKLLKKDDTNKMFIMFDFVKKPRKTKKAQSHNATDLLKPCVYKKR
ncbi:methyltransferase-domain-containing protein [Glomus cerebriforme]|uniref:Ribosomal RNA-processing protein 8 n=1 Tax=Glomus cerebriforme TaxID=658196 RepID=A0A397THT2_9GLOM|nr:methyltransferase-domain-containing protein [Glomus cerebriforme]